MDDRLRRARRRLLSGDRAALERLVDDDRDLVHGRFETVEPPYDGYFHGATLLHHVAGNPLVDGLPSNVEELAELLLDRGAEVDAVTRQGPSQPDDIGWTTLGLVATSSEARSRGHQRSLMELLLARGADVDARSGGCIMGALYYGESSAAELLARRGARLDLIAAAGVGDMARMRALLENPVAGGPRPAADVEDAEPGGGGGFRLAHYSRVPWPVDAGRDDVLGMALIYAALHGRVSAIDLLLEAGAQPDHHPPFDHGGTALHWAVMGDRPESVRALLEAGANPGGRDHEHDATPAEWALHLGRPRAAEALKSGPARDRG